MKTFVFSALVDALLSLVLAFFACFTLLLSFKLYKPSAILISAVIAAAFSFVVYVLSARRKMSISLKDESKTINQCMDIFNVCTYDENLKFFSSVFNSMGISASITDEHILLENGNIVLPCFFPSPLDGNLLKIMTDRIKVNSKRIIVLSAKFTADAIIYAKSADMSVFEAKDVFSFLKESNRLPDLKRVPKQRFYHGFFTRLFVRNNGVRFILFGLSLLIMAFMVFYPVYYYISGAVFILFGIVSLIFAKPLRREKNDLLRDLRDQV